MGATDDLGYRIDRAGRVRRPADGDEPRPIGEGRVELLERQRAVGVVDVERPDDEPAVRRDRLPRPDIPLVVEDRDHDLIAGLERGRDRAADVEG